MCYVASRESGGSGYYLIFEVDSSDPANPVLHDPGVTNPVAFGTGQFYLGDRIDVSPRGDRAFVRGEDDVYNFDLVNFLANPNRIINQFVQPGRIDMDFTPDGSLVYAVNQFDGNPDSLIVFDFGGADNLALASGNSQTGIAGQPLQAPLRVRATSGGLASRGVVVEFSADPGSGYFAASNSATQFVTTDAQGYAQVEWILGPEVGPQTVYAIANSLAGSPIQFTATAVANPALLPLEFAGIVPADGAQAVGITTTIIASFSRSVDPTTVNPSNVLLYRATDSQVIFSKLGFTDENRKVSLTPVMPLDVNTTYTLEIRTGIKDASGGDLVNPVVSSFTTVPPPPLKLSSVCPPSSARQLMIVIAGRGFSPTSAENSVLFNELAVTPVEAGSDYLKVIVPPEAQSGTIRVQTGAQISNAIPFAVLEPLSAAPDHTVAEVGTNAVTKSLVIHPSGIWAYAVSPEGNVVVPINIPQRRSLPAIPVGNHPVSVAMHPEGTFVYAANFQSSSVSIIDVDPASPDFLAPDTTLAVGNYPIDLTVSSDGDRVYVVSAGSDEEHNVDILDSDEASANYHSVLATIGTGAATRSVVMTPDGSRLYFGTDTGYIVLDAIDYGVLATIRTGAATKSVVMHPDGGLLFILTTEGQVLIVDIMQGSTRENSVLATIRTGKATKSITLSPDGLTLYLVQEELDIILVLRLVITGSATVIDPDAEIPPVQVSYSIVDSIYAGEDPEVIVFDPSGSGLALVVNSGPQTV
ncbi:MAG: Ig-like domain-containing protein, partial [Chitinivibrionia bacterium]|nr:Ig-like domain-containing protein [Chitinivibrionia bacterium]